MSNLGESDADAFFQMGDEGTYTGGPADTMAPVGLVDAEETRELLGLPTAAQLERRERLQRLVSRIVGSLAVASLLVFAMRFASHPSHDEVSARSSVGDGVAATQAPAVEHAAPAAAPQGIDPAAAARALAAVQAAPEPVVEPIPAAAAPAPEAVARPVTPAAAEPRTVVQQPAAAPGPVAAEAGAKGRVAASPRVPSMPVARHVEPAVAAPIVRSRTTAAPAPARGAQTPPTASFASFPD